MLVALHHAMDQRFGLTPEQRRDFQLLYGDVPGWYRRSGRRVAAVVTASFRCACHQLIHQ